MVWLGEIIENFSYAHFYIDPQTLGVVLLFQGTHKGKPVEGANFFKLNEEGKVTELKVMLRPTTMAIGVEMKKRFRALTEFGTPLEASRLPEIPISAKL